jgi:cytochrome c5
MNLRAIIFTGIISASVAFPGLSQTGKPASSTTAKQQKPTSPAPADAPRVHDGQKVFEQNCGRCHNAPQGFSPSISGAVSRHMRARANLSQADYEALLHFLNP